MSSYDSKNLKAQRKIFSKSVAQRKIFSVEITSKREQPLSSSDPVIRSRDESFDHHRRKVISSPGSPIPTCLNSSDPWIHSMNSSAEIWNAVHSTSSSDSLGSPQIARVNHSPSRRGRPTGQYETFVPLLPFHSSTFDQRMRDLPIDGLVDLYKANQEFQYYLASQERLDYLAERFMLEHCTSFENLMVSYEMRKCLPAGSIYRSEEDQFFWAIYDNNLSAAKVSRIKMKKERRVPNYSMIMKLAIEKGNDETEMLHWLLTDATLHRVSVSYQELLETSITFDRSNTFWHLLAVVNRLGLIIDMGRLLGVAKNHNRKEIVRVMANHC